MIVRNSRHTALRLASTVVALLAVVGLLAACSKSDGEKVDDAPLPTDGARVRSGSRVVAGHTTFAVEAHRTRPARRTPSGDGTLAVNPTPHLPQPTAPATIRVPPEPTAAARRRIPWLMVLLPLPFAGLLAVFFGPRMLLFGLLSPLLVLGSTLSDRTTSRREHREAHAQWVRDRAATGERLAAALRTERRHRLRSAPDASALLDAADSAGLRTVREALSRLFE